jgi:hypothetical protein
VQVADTITIPSGATISNLGTATGFGGGKVLQVVSTNKTDTFATSSIGNTFVDLRDSTAINIGTGSMGNRTPASTVAIGENYDTNRGEVSSINFLDSPNTTSEITYKIQVGILEATTNVARVNTSGGDGDFTYIARSASTITVMEIAP